MPEPGDLLVWHYCSYDHWGVYIGNQQVVEYGGQGSSLSQQKLNAKVGIGPLRDGYIVHRGSDLEYLFVDREKVVERAKSAVGRGDYNLVSNNCESFAKSCLSGKPELSSQVGAFVKAVAGVTAIALVSRFGLSFSGTTATLSATILPQLDGPTIVIASGPIGVVVGGAAIGVAGLYGIYKGLRWLASN